MSAKSKPVRVMRLIRYPVTALATLGLLAGPLASNAAAPIDRSTVTAAELNLLDRVTWGANASSVASLKRLGEDRWLEQQLHPTAADVLPPAAQAQIDAMLVSKTPLAKLVVDLDTQNKATQAIADPEQKKLAQQAYQTAMNDLAKQAQARSLLRDLYSPAQLREQMTWFWFNHFNVHLAKANVRAMVGDYEDTAIRPYALGRFRDLVGATLRHPAMLRYLDNADNAGGKINENYARELLELHTMGVGSGYSQADVQELARVLTGVGIDQKPDNPKLKPELQGQLIRAGLFEFNPARHDYGDKVLLGQTIRAGASPRSSRRWTCYAGNQRPRGISPANWRPISSPTARRRRWSSG